MNRILLVPFVCWLLCVCFGTQSIQAQTVSISADSTQMEIGDWLGIQLQIQHPTNAYATIPVWETADLGVFEVLEASEIDTLSHEANIQLQQKLILTAFDSGSFSVPPILIIYQQDALVDTLYTDSLLIEIGSPAVDTTQAIKPIKSPLEVSLSTKKRLLWLGIFLFLLAGFALWWFVFRKKEKPLEIFKRKEPELPPHIWASQQLKALEKSRRWEQGQVKDYYVELTEIVRTYIERSFEIDALESTTDELMPKIRANTVTAPYHDALKRMLERADLVKFAKMSPLPDENADSMRVAVQFVEATKPKETE